MLGLGLHLVQTAVRGGASTRPTGPQILISNRNQDENTAIGTTIGSFTVVGGTGTYTFTKTADPDSAFTLTSGTLKNAIVFDYETATSHNVTIHADNGSGSTADRTLAIFVNDIDEVPPVITVSPSQTVAENSAFSLTLTADKPVTWTKTGGADTALFTLTSGVLTMTAKDFEVPTDANTDNAYVVQVTATSTAFAVSTNMTITVTVTDVAGPTITSSATGSVAENSIFTRTLTASESVTWAKTGGADQALFTLSGATLSLPAQDFEAPADADANNTYVVQVKATSVATGEVSAAQTITVTVTDVSEGTSPPAAPTLVLTSGTGDNTPDFTLTGALVVGDTVRFQYDTNSGFTAPTDVTNTIDSTEDAANTLNFSTGTLADGTWSFRARIESPVAGNSGWSNTETETISTTVPDTTAPTLSSPTDTKTGSTTADLAVTTDEANGTLYGVVTTSTTAPTATQVKTGKDHTGATATVAFSQAVTATGAQLKSVTGLTASTFYAAHFMHEDAATNQSTVANGDGFTTDASGGSTDVTPDVIGTYLHQSSSSSFNYTGLTITAGLTNPALICTLVRSAATSDVIDGLAVTWDGVPMTLVSSATDVSGSGFGCFIFGLVNPASGAKTLHVSGTNAADSNSVNCVSFSNVNPIDAINAFQHAASVTSAPTSLNVTSAAGHIAVGAAVGGTAPGVVLGTTIMNDFTLSTTQNALADYVVSTGSPTAVGTNLSQVLLCGVDIVPPYGAGFITVWDNPLTDNVEAGWGGLTYVQTIPGYGTTTGGAPALGAAAGSTCRVTIKFAALGAGVAVALYVARQATSGDVYDFNTTPTHVLFGGGNITGNGTTLTYVSDSFTLPEAYDPTKTLNFAFDFGAGTVTAPTATLPGTAYHKRYGGPNDAATVNKSGYASDGDNDVEFVAKIEISP